MEDSLKKLLLLTITAVTLSAHHSPSAEFDMTKRTTVKGTLTKVDWINPHINVFIDAKDDKGRAENWRFESNPPAWFKRVGIGRADLMKGSGQTVTVLANRAKDGSAFGYMTKITFADGTSLELTTPDQK